MKKMVEKPIGITVLAVLFTLNGLSLLLSSFRLVGSVIFTAMFMVGIFNLLEAWGVWNLKSWARTMGIILAVLSLPVSGFISIGVLYFLLAHNETKQIFN